MGTLTNALKSLFYSNNSNAASATSRIPLLDTNGNPVGSDTLANINSKNPLYTGGVFCASLEEASGSYYYRFRQASQAATYKATAVGAAVFEAGKLLIIAKDESATTLQWASSNVTGGSGNKSREAAVADMNGRTNTSTIISTLGEAASAASYCASYCPSFVEGSMSTVAGAGKWWLPSMGELFMMWSHFTEINMVMSLIGGTPLPAVSHWSSTEYSATNAWHLNFSNGNFYINNKTSQYRVRPVSAYY